MEAHSNWHNRVVEEVEVCRTSLTEKEFKSYKLDFLLKIAGRVEEFYGTCGQCQLFQQDITQFVKELSMLTQMPSTEGRKSYLKKIDAITGHLQKQHKLVKKGQYVGIWVAIGTAIGVAIGIALDNPGIGPALGVGIGLAVGSYLDRKARQEGWVL